MANLTPEQKLDLILETVLLIFQAMEECPEEDDLEHMEPVGPAQ